MSIEELTEEACDLVMYEHLLKKYDIDSYKKKENELNINIGCTQRKIINKINEVWSEKFPDRELNFEITEHDGHLTFDMISPLCYHTGEEYDFVENLISYKMEFCTTARGFYKK